MVSQKYKGGVYIPTSILLSLAKLEHGVVETQPKIGRQHKTGGGIQPWLLVAGAANDVSEVITPFMVRTTYDHSSM
jgi:hypothetical protein